MGESVIILHGLGRRAWSMRRLAAAMRARGYVTVCPAYPSRSKGIDGLVAHLLPALPAEGRVHMIGHSLGGILAIHLMNSLPEGRRGRIMQLGAPNLGSVLAERSRRFATLFGPALAELAGPQITPAPGLEIAGIAGTGAWPAYGLLTGLKGSNDGKVSVESALAHASQSLTLPLYHYAMMNDATVIAATQHFIETGQLAQP